MIKSVVLAFASSAALLGAPAAHAGVHWSVGVNLPVPVVGAVVSNGPMYNAYGPVDYGYAYGAAPVYAPPRVVVAPSYGYGYRPRPVYYRPAPVFVHARYYRHHGWR